MQPLNGSFVPSSSDIEEIERSNSKDRVRRRSNGRLLDCYRAEANWEDTIGTERFASNQK